MKIQITNSYKYTADKFIVFSNDDCESGQVEIMINSRENITLDVRELFQAIHSFLPFNQGE